MDCSKRKSIAAAVDNLTNDQAYILEIVGTPSAIINGLAVVPPVAAVHVTNSRAVRIANFTINGALTPRSRADDGEHQCDDHGGVPELHDSGHNGEP